MRVLIFGGTGMVGQGALRECLASPSVSEIVAVTRSPLGISFPKLHEWRRTDFLDWTDAATDLRNFDVCLFCLGISSLGMNEADYRRTTYDVTLATARALFAGSPQCVFEYISGASTDTQSRQMWARVKGETEDALLALPFRAVYCLRPGYIQPLDGVRSKVGWYNAVYSLLGWTYPLLRRAFPNHVTDSRSLGQAMLRLAAHGAPKHILENDDLNHLARTATPIS